MAGSDHRVLSLQGAEAPSEAWRAATKQSLYDGLGLLRCACLLSLPPAMALK